VKVVVKEWFTSKKSSATKVDVLGVGLNDYIRARELKEKGN